MRRSGIDPGGSALAAAPSGSCTRLLSPIVCLTLLHGARLGIPSAGEGFTAIDRPIAVVKTPIQLYQSLLHQDSALLPVDNTRIQLDKGTDSV
jgi:hypothetical protein